MAEWRAIESEHLIQIILQKSVPSKNLIIIIIIFLLHVDHRYTVTTVV